MLGDHIRDGIGTALSQDMGFPYKIDSGYLQ